MYFWIIIAQHLSTHRACGMQLQPRHNAVLVEDMLFVAHTKTFNSFHKSQSICSTHLTRKLSHALLCVEIFPAHGALQLLFHLIGRNTNGRYLGNLIACQRWRTGAVHLIEQLRNNRIDSVSTVHIIGGIAHKVHWSGRTAAAAADSAAGRRAIGARHRDEEFVYDVVQIV